MSNLVHRLDEYRKAKEGGDELAIASTAMQLCVDAGIDIDAPLNKSADKLLREHDKQSKRKGRWKIFNNRS